MSENNLKSDIIEEMFTSIVPTACIGEQYADDVALIFQPTERTVEVKTKYQKVDIVKTPYWGQILFLDNLLMKTDRDGHIINEMIVHPVMLTGSKKKKALVVGGGEGFTATLLLKYPYIERVDVIDIDGEFVEICKKHYPEQMKCLDDPRVNLIVQDGLEYMRSTNEVYDAIFTTPTDPLSLSDPLFVDEYYRLCYKCLADDGIYETDAYMPFYKYGNIDYAVIQKNIAKYFPISKIYTCTVPTFPGGLFSFGFGSKKYDPLNDQQQFDFEITTQYYNADIHKACFALPQFMQERIKEETLLESKISQIATLLQDIHRATFEDNSIVINKRTFDGHKTKDDAQEVNLQKDDKMILITSSLAYDLNLESIKMIAKSLVKGVKYEYLIENTQENQKSIEEFLSFLKEEVASYIADNNIEYGLQEALDNIKLSLLEKGKFIYNFAIVQLNRGNGHVAFYFTKMQDGVEYCYEALYDNHPALIKKLYLAYEKLCEIATPY